MRRKYFGLAIAAIATFGPMQAWGGDREIAEQIIKRLKSNRDSGALKDFTLDMKVDEGVVLFRGSVAKDAQKQLVLATAKGIDGITKITDEVKIVTAAPTMAVKAPVAKPDLASLPTPAPKVAKVKAESKVAELESSSKKASKLASKPAPKTVAKAKPSPFSFKQALSAKRTQAQPVVPGTVRPVSAAEPQDDAEVVAAVVSALRDAKAKGELVGFGVDVRSNNGVLQLTGRASSSQQRDKILKIAANVNGVAGVREAIAIPSATPAVAAVTPQLPEPPSLQEVALAPVAVDPVSRPSRLASDRTAAAPVAAPVQSPVMTTPYRAQAAPVGAMPASAAAPMGGQPVPMAPYAAVGAPRYDSPNMPNYAWPGYAAYPNYAALTYPQQYSPSAWPYIGPFYPYPQVPMGWRKISLEWDDGWWFLDFTDR
ncbi:MAG: BON domain-containing protein [Planctomycetaceae bacterium]|nr:BON domain-containing protein [Planctomycetaceae bacterium]